MHILVTGGAGFIGCNLTHALLAHGHRVTIFDNLSRPGSERNLAWLHRAVGAIDVIRGVIRHAEALVAAAADVDAIVHLAGQVAVTTSVLDPRTDFEINALGTFNVLEAARAAAHPPIVLYASTNKVYGGMDDIAIVEEATRYRYRDHPAGIAETQPLDFHSPYGCSKGAGDQYVRDYHRIYGLRTVVFRQSAIYGPRQFGVEDQGWAAHFIIAAQCGRPISIFGDGKQVRDMLYIDDLIAAYERAIAAIDRCAGAVLNIGGGAANTLAIWTEFEPLISRLSGAPVAEPQRGPWRPGDQLVCVLDTSRAGQLLGWRPQVGVTDGIARLWHWVAANRHLF